MATTFDPKLPGESESFGFDFVKRLAAGQSIVSAVVTATPAGLTVGAAAVAGTVAYALVSGGTAGVVYDLLVLATLNDGSVIGYCTPLKIMEC